MQLSCLLALTTLLFQEDARSWPLADDALSTEDLLFGEFRLTRRAGDDVVQSNVQSTDDDSLRSHTLRHDLDTPGQEGGKRRSARLQQAQKEPPPTEEAIRRSQRLKTPKRMIDPRLLDLGASQPRKMANLNELVDDPSRVSKKSSSLQVRPPNAPQVSESFRPDGGSQPVRAHSPEAPHNNEQLQPVAVFHARKPSDQAPSLIGNANIPERSSSKLLVVHPHPEKGAEQPAQHTRHGNSQALVSQPSLAERPPSPLHGSFSRPQGDVQVVSSPPRESGQSGSLLRVTSPLDRQQSLSLDDRTQGSQRIHESPTQHGLERQAPQNPSGQLQHSSKLRSRQQLGHREGQEPTGSNSKQVSQPVGAQQEVSGHSPRGHERPHLARSSQGRDEHSLSPPAADVHAAESIPRSLGAPARDAGTAQGTSRPPERNSIGMFMGRQARQKRKGTSTSNAPEDPKKQRFDEPHQHGWRPTPGSGDSGSIPVRSLDHQHYGPWLGGFSHGFQRGKESLAGHILYRTAGRRAWKAGKEGEKKGFDDGVKHAQGRIDSIRRMALDQGRSDGLREVRYSTFQESLHALFRPHHVTAH